jgi:hypothetical protein
MCASYPVVAHGRNHLSQCTTVVKPKPRCYRALSARLHEITDNTSKQMNEPKKLLLRHRAANKVCLPACGRTTLYTRDTRQHCNALTMTLIVDEISHHITLSSSREHGILAQCGGSVMNGGSAMRCLEPDEKGTSGLEVVFTCLVLVTPPAGLLLWLGCIWTLWVALRGTVRSSRSIHLEIYDTAPVGDSH